MKKSGFVICFLILAVSAFGQQVLWTTVRGADAKHISLSSVTREVLKYYDQFDYYYDFTGFDKDAFIETFDDEDEDDWGWIYEINTMTIVATRVYIEGGSAVYVMCIRRDGIDMVAFSNVIDDGCIETSKSRKPRFEQWFKTLLK